MMVNRMLEQTIVSKATFWVSGIGWVVHKVVVADAHQAGDCWNIYGIQCKPSDWSQGLGGRAACT